MESFAPCTLLIVIVLAIPLRRVLEHAGMPAPREQRGGPANAAFARELVRMIPRAEIALIVAKTGRSSGAPGQEAFASIVPVSGATALGAPILLRRLQNFSKQRTHANS